MRFNKKAISPLIATVLLIAFSISVGVLVVNWGQNYVENQTREAGERADTQMACGLDVDLDFVYAGATPQICDEGPGNIKFTLENSARTSIKNLTVNILGNNNTNSTVLTANINSGGVQRFNISYDVGIIGNLTQIRIAPTVETESGSITTCSGDSLIIESIPLC